MSSILLRSCLAVFLAMPFMIGCRILAAAEINEPMELPGNDERVTAFTIQDGATCNSVGAGKLTLSGKLKLHFAGRILPHENTRVALYGGSISSIAGKFDEVRLPDGWRCDIKYDYEKPEVLAENFRPDRPPAFPGAEGFGKYAIDGRGGKVLAVTN